MTINGYIKIIINIFPIRILVSCQCKRPISMYILIRGRVTIYIQYQNQPGNEGEEKSSSQPSNASDNIRQQLGTLVTHLGTFF